MPLLRTEHLSRVANGRVVVDDVSIDVDQGDVLAVVGRSGAGKSSFLRLLNRLDEPTRGTVYLDGNDFRTMRPRELRRRVGLVAQTAALFPGTVADNIGFGPRQTGVILSEEAVAGLLRQVGLPDFAAHPVDNLSGGEGQRVAIARALANEPSVLLLDEPTSALDDEAKRGIESLIASIVRDRGLACVVVTHDMAHGRIEAALALGAAPEISVSSFVQSSFRASLIPAIDNLRSLGIVWIPGLMTGMVLAGSPPVMAAIYQFVMIAMIFASSGLTCLVSTTLIRRRAFSAAEQLVLRPGATPLARRSLR